MGKKTGSWYRWDEPPHRCLVGLVAVGGYRDGKSHKWDDWYYCQYHKYDVPNDTKPYFKAWVTYKPTGNHYWESFYWWQYQG